MLSTKTATALVGSARAHPVMATNVSIKVLRAFLHGGQAHAVGSLLEVPPALAAELIGMNKAERAPKPHPQPTQEQAPAPTSARKGKSDAQ